MPNDRLFRYCPRCGGGGFDTLGTGYDNVCSDCGGERYEPLPDGSMVISPDEREELAEICERNHLFEWGVANGKRADVASRWAKRLREGNDG